MTRAIRHLAASALLCMSFACADATPSRPNTSCLTDTDCPDAQHCGANGSCKLDCDAQTPCAGALECSSRGRCLDTSAECAVAADCALAPEPARCDGEQLIAPGTSAICQDTGAGRRCALQATIVTCEHGCDGAAGACAEAPDLCEDAVCDTPPAPRCSGSRRITYASMGECTSRGSCVYGEQSETCAYGCEAGACRPGGCAGVTCMTPPADSCSATLTNVAVSYEAQGECRENDGAASCFYPNALDNCDYYGATCEQGACVNPRAQTGQVIVTEIMAEPAPPLTGFAHEWFEVFNTTAQDIDLRGWTLRSAKTNSADLQTHVIAPPDADLDGQPDPLILAAGARMLIAISGEDPLGDGVTHADYRYGSALTLTATDTIELVDPQGQLSDLVYWERGSMMRGRARQLDPQAMQSATGNDNYRRWCPSLGQAYGPDSANVGTPGQPNVPCPVDLCAGFDCGPKPEPFCNSRGGVVTYTADTAACTVSRFQNPFCDFAPMTTACDPASGLCTGGVCAPLPSSLPAAGEVIFTEIMGDPRGTDGEAEWVELYNTTDRELSLFSLLIEDNEPGTRYSRSRILDLNATIAPRSHRVFITNTDPAINGDITSGLLLEGGLLKNTNLEVDADGVSLMRLRLVTRDGLLIDEVFYDKPVVGRAQQLSLDAYENVPNAAMSNDTGARFCLASDEYSATRGAGTPGAPNVVCPIQ